MNASDAPLVSVVIPCWNQGRYLAEAVDSALAQTWPELEVIVVNDGSDEAETLRLLKNFERPRTRLLHRENGGPSAALNTGVTAARGEFILPLNDDRLLPTYVEKALRVFQNHDDVRVVTCKARYFDAKTGPWELPAYTMRSLLRRNLLHVSSLYRRKDWERVGGYCEELPIRIDYDFWLSLLELGGRIHRIEEELFEYRKPQQRQKSLSKRSSRMMEAQAFARIRERHLKLYADHTDLLVEWLNEVDLQRVALLDNRLGSRIARFFKGLR